MDGHSPFEIVQEKTYIPCALTVAVDDPLFGLLKVAVPGPLFTDQTPLPIVGVFPPRELLVNMQLT